DDPRERLRAGSAVRGQLVVDRSTGPRDRLRRARVHDDRLRPRRYPQPEAARAMSLLSIEDLRITYTTLGGGVPAVRGVDMTIERGQVMGLAGESGCGKSTIAQAILRILPAGAKVEGRIDLEGQDILTMGPG